MPSGVYDRSKAKGGGQYGITRLTKEAELAINGTDEATELAAFTVKCAAIAKGADRHDVQGMYDRFGQYLQLCAECKKRVGNMAAYLAMGIDRKIASDWRIGRSGSDEQKALIDYVDSICAAYRELLMNENKLSAPVGIFWQKNYDGMKDIQDVVMERPKLLGADADAETIADKYADLPED